MFNGLDLGRTRRRFNNPAVGPGQPWLVKTGTMTTGDEDDKYDKQKHVSGVILNGRCGPENEVLVMFIMLWA